MQSVIIPDKFNRVDMGGIDVVESQGVVVNGLYQRLVNSISNCKYQCLYNWKFNGIDVAPTYVELIILAGVVKINKNIWVTQDDVIHIYSIEPPPVVPVIEPIEIDQNGIYAAPQGVDGFSPVNVLVESEYEQIPYEFFGLATAYQATNGSFYTELGKTQCLSFAKIYAGYKYVVFLPQTVSSRFRVGLWPGKTFSDFEPYLDTLGTNILIYTGATMVTPSQELEGNDLNLRFFFTGVDGEIIIGTSNVSQLIKPILLKIKEEN